MEQSPSWKLTGFAASQEIPPIYGTPKFITVLTSARHLSLSWTHSIQSPQPPPTTLISLLILSSHLRLGLSSGLVSLGFPNKTLCTPLPSPICATCPAHHILLDFTIPNIKWQFFLLGTVNTQWFSVEMCGFLGYQAVQRANPHSEQSNVSIPMP
jgi:hypothetical protein